LLEILYHLHSDGQFTALRSWNKGCETGGAEVAGRGGAEQQDTKVAIAHECAGLVAMSENKSDKM